MRRMVLALALVPAIAVAQDVPPPRSAQGDVAVTIYNNDLALVQDTRQLNLPSGITRQDFSDVSDSIRPATVRLSADGVTIVEQNFDYDLLSPEALMEKAVGQTITIVRTNPATGTETRERALVLANNGGVVMRIGDRIEVLRDDGLPVRVVFDSLPPNLRARPTLSVTLDSARGGTRPVTLSYLAGGFGWNADYVALFDEAKGAIDVQGWVTLRNNNDTPLVNADTVLVAGAPGSVQERNQRRMSSRPGYAPGSQPGTETAARARLGDFYLYPLAARTTIAAKQQKQVSFLSIAAVPARKAYEYRVDWLETKDEAESASTVLAVSSSSAGGLGDALPAGTVRVYIRDASGQPQFIGESAIGHTPMGSSLALVTGQAFDVKVKPVVEKRERIDANEWKRVERYRITENGNVRTVEIDRATTFNRTTMRYELTNARPQPVTVEIVQAGLDNYWHDTRVSSESVKGEQRSADERIWRVPVPANGSATLTAVIDTRY
ncbi:DUF4139 domain-containing protein [Sphingomonas radiodurans]|uniref:DUF4139 domain-containing protein n=1 Tax=Sphingomonas radiodurans TaxID=2890321 RepID=UPI001E3574FA|nr:DUF4139 domain-containing protein [Sphingomonas radiodurans]WBH15440.1 DUF4139 domain-containing protein [Sphingomonas radiodurans]